MRILAARGISESMERNTLSPVRDHFPNTEWVEIPWSASYGPVNHAGNKLGGSFKRSLVELERMLRDALDEKPAILLGYSGGAAGAGNVASLGHPNLIAAGFVADPFAPPVNNRWGVAGKRVRPISVPAIWKRDPKDVITNARPNARLRTFADQSEALSLGDPAGWSADLIDRLIRQRWQVIARNPLDIRRLWIDFNDDISDAEGYLFGGDHTSYGRRREANGRTYIENLAIWVAQQKSLYEKELVRG